MLNNITSAAIILSLLLSDVNPDFHTFSILDMDLSYPNRSAKLSTPLFVFLTIILPILGVVTSSLLVSSRKHSAQQNLTLSEIRLENLHYLNSALLGLGVSLATATVLVTGVKNLTGKPRPNFLSICDPDLDNIENFTVGSFGARFNRFWVMVDVEICKQTDKVALRDGFRSFPSGFATCKFLRSEKSIYAVLNVVLSCVCGLVVSIAVPLPQVWRHFSVPVLKAWQSASSGPR